MGSEGTTGLISYIRTDSTRISREAQKQALDYIKEAFGDKYIPDKVKVYKAKEGSQDAHEAIRPTSVDRTPGKVKKYLNKDQYRLYKLIWERFVASQMSPAQYKQVKVLIKAGDKYIFRAKGSRIIFPGFLRVNTSSQKKRHHITTC